MAIIIFSSFCYIEDVLDGIFKVMNSELPGPINIGSDVDCNLDDLVNNIIRQTNSKSRIIHAENLLS